ncbi:MerR family transcriptional regulator [Dissulfurirhabdus thermomarina]|uniref:MerR family transcriptional regulator n=1 Tax=Dissulfurirhabdus thermomarina TaxID=1765737 RepID=A0A6N9TYN7_DISTH|nr:MerR family transcriptional regulator [Dissulfurirhabdus thermomarina]NDY43566.1 MerR family transcriptional regulator [Dissulfurirhabdus thermomarina]NMX24544.1 MerR family transcriptional regulator [Dissulfurirhabdus thermomarina]
MRTDKALFPIGTAAEILDLHPRTLRVYEAEGLLRPERKGRWRYYGPAHIHWVRCLKAMIDDQGLSLAALKRLLRHVPCWHVGNCPPARRRACEAFLAAGPGAEG